MAAGQRIGLAMERMKPGNAGLTSALDPERSQSIAQSLILAIVKTQPGLSKQKRGELIAALEASWSEQRSA